MARAMNCVFVLVVLVDSSSFLVADALDGCYAAAVDNCTVDLQLLLVLPTDASEYDSYCNRVTWIQTCLSGLHCKNGTNDTIAGITAASAYLCQVDIRPAYFANVACFLKAADTEKSCRSVSFKSSMSDADTCSASISTFDCMFNATTQMCDLLTARYLLTYYYRLQQPTLASHYGCSLDEGRLWCNATSVGQCVVKLMTTEPSVNTTAFDEFCRYTDSVMDCVESLTCVPGDDGFNDQLFGAGYTMAMKYTCSLMAGEAAVSVRQCAVRAYVDGSAHCMRGLLKPPVTKPDMCRYYREGLPTCMHNYASKHAQLSCSGVPLAEVTFDVDAFINLAYSKPAEDPRVCGPDNCTDVVRSVMPNLSGISTPTNEAEHHLMCSIIKQVQSTLDSEDCARALSYYQAGLLDSYSFLCQPDVAPVYLANIECIGTYAFEATTTCENANIPANLDSSTVEQICGFYDATYKCSFDQIVKDCNVDTARGSIGYYDRLNGHRLASSYGCYIDVGRFLCSTTSISFCADGLMQKTLAWNATHDEYMAFIGKAYWSHECLLGITCTVSDSNYVYWSNAYSKARATLYTNLNWNDTASDDSRQCGFREFEEGKAFCDTAILKSGLENATNPEICVYYQEGLPSCTYNYVRSSCNESIADVMSVYAYLAYSEPAMFEYNCHFDTCPAAVQNCVGGIQNASMPTSQQEYDNYCRLLEEANMCISDVNCTNGVSAAATGLLNGAAFLCQPDIGKVYLDNNACILSRTSSIQQAICYNESMAPSDVSASNTEKCRQSNKYYDCLFNNVRTQCGLDSARGSVSYLIRRDANTLLSWFGCTIDEGRFWCDADAIDRCRSEPYPPPTDAEYDVYCTKTENAKECLDGFTCLNTDHTYSSAWLQALGSSDAQQYMCTAYARQVMLANYECAFSQSSMAQSSCYTSSFSSSLDNATNEDICRYYNAMQRCMFDYTLGSCNADTARVTTTFFNKMSQRPVTIYNCVLDTSYLSHGFVTAPTAMFIVIAAAVCMLLISG